MSDKELQQERNWVDRYEDGIRKGLYQFSDVGARDWKEEIKDRLMVDISSGTATETIIKAVVTYFRDQIIRKRITIGDIPDVLRDRVKEAD